MKTMPRYYQLFSADSDEAVASESCLLIPSTNMCCEEDLVAVSVEDGRVVSRDEVAAEVVVVADDSNDFGWMEQAAGPPIKTTATMLAPGRYALIRLEDGDGS